MRLLGIFLSACVLLALVKAAIVALFLLFLVALIWGLFLRPREVMAFLAYCALLGLVGAHPTATLVIVGVAIAIVPVVHPAQSPPDQSDPQTK